MAMGLETPTRSRRVLPGLVVGHPKAEVGVLRPRRTGDANETRGTTAWSDPATLSRFSDRAFLSPRAGSLKEAPLTGDTPAVNRGASQSSQVTAVTSKLASDPTAP